MNGLEAALKASSLASMLQQQMAPAMQLSKMLDPLKSMRDQLNFLNMEHAIFKGLRSHVGYENSLTKGFESIAIAKAIKTTPIPMSVIPSGTFDTLKSISFQHNELFERLRRITELYKPLHAVSQLNSLRFAMNGLSAQLAEIAAAEQQWDLLDDFEKRVSEKMVEVVDNFDQGVELTDFAKEKLKGVWAAIVSFYGRNKKFAARTSLFVSIVMTTAGIHQYVDFLIPKKEAASKEDVLKIQVAIEKLSEEQINAQLELEEFKHQVTKLVVDSLLQAGKLRATVRECKVFLKPDTTSPVITTLPSEFQITVVQESHKWLYIDYIDPTDNLSQRGWAMKKYVQRLSRSN